MYIGILVKYRFLLSEFNQTWEFFWTDCRKILSFVFQFAILNVKDQDI